jgi:hypothetical protein
MTCTLTTDMSTFVMLKANSAEQNLENMQTPLTYILHSAGHVATCFPLSTAPTGCSTYFSRNTCNSHYEPTTHQTARRHIPEDRNVNIN